MTTTTDKLKQMLTTSSSTKKALGNTSWMLIEKGVTMAANLGVTLILARSLGPADFGILSYYLALLLLVGPITSMGMNAVVTRELVNNPDDKKKIMSTTAAFRLLGGLLGNTLIVTWAWGFSNFNHDELQLFSIMAIANVFYAFQVVEFYFQSIVSIRYVSVMRATNVLTFGAIKLIAVMYGYGLNAITTIFALELASLGLGYISLYTWQAKGFSLRSIDFHYGYSLLKNTFWLILSGVSSLIYLKIDQVMLGNLAGFSEAGTYAVAARLSEVWYFLSDAIVLSFFSMLIAQKKENPGLYFHNLQKLCDGLYGVSVLIAIGVSLVAHPAILILFGDEYSLSASILVVHIWAGVFAFMRALVGKWMIAENLFVYSLVSDGLGAAFNIGANYLLIPHYGGMGAAWATIVSYAAANYVGFWLFPKTRPIALVMTRSLLLPFTGFSRYWPKKSTE